MTIALEHPVLHSTAIALPARFQASYTTRLVAVGVDKRPSDFWLETAGTPQAGDVVIARVTAINNHKRVETPESRKARTQSAKMASTPTLSKLTGRVMMGCGPLPGQ